MENLYLKFSNIYHPLCESILDDSELLKCLIRVLVPEDGRFYVDMSDTPVNERAACWFSYPNYRMYENEALIDCMNAFGYLSCTNYFLACGERYASEIKLGLIQRCNKREEFSRETVKFFESKFEHKLDIFDIVNIFGDNFSENPNFKLLKSFIKFNADHVKEENLHIFDGVKSVDLRRHNPKMTRVLRNCRHLLFTPNQPKQRPFTVNQKNRVVAS